MLPARDVICPHCGFSNHVSEGSKLLGCGNCCKPIKDSEQINTDFPVWGIFRTIDTGLDHAEELIELFTHEPEANRRVRHEQRRSQTPVCVRKIMVNTDD